MDPAGRYSSSYEHDAALVRTLPQALTLLVFLFALLMCGIFGSPRLLSIGTSIATTSVIVIGLQITTGYAGQVNIGQAAFAGVGAYCTAVLAGRYALPFWCVLPLAGFAAALFGVIFGVAAVRIKGFYLALTTIAAQALFPFIVLNLPAAWLGGSAGLTVPAARLAGQQLNDERSMYLLSLVVCVLMAAGAFGIVRGRFGRAFIAVCDDEVAAGMTGIAVARAKALAFFVGAFYAGVGGSLIAYQIRYVNTETFTFFQSIWYVAMIIVGGLGSLTGAIVGTTVIRFLQEAITTLGPSLAGLIPSLGNAVVFASMNMLLGGVIAAFLIFEPEGLMHRWQIMKLTFRRWPFPR